MGSSLAVILRLDRMLSGGGRSYSRFAKRRIINKVVATRSLAVLPLAGGRGTIACDGGRSHSRFVKRKILYIARQYIAPKGKI